MHGIEKLHNCTFLHSLINEHTQCSSLQDSGGRPCQYIQYIPCITMWCTNPGGIYLFKVNNGNIIRKCVICSKLTIKTAERFH